MKPTPEPNTSATLQPCDQFQAALEQAYTHLFATDPGYEAVSRRVTPLQLAERMVDAFQRGLGNKDGQGVINACRALGIKPTNKAINQFLNL
jgi:hypothetical protein